MHYLKSPSFVDPFLIARLRVGPSVEGIVINQFVILVDGVELKFEDVDIGKFRLGSKVFLHLAGKFWFETEDEILAHKEAAIERHKQVEMKRMEAYRKQREEDIRFNNSLNIPVEWVPGQKDVLSGLSANSMGNGQKRNTVYHVLLKEPLHDGKLHRSADDFLCSSLREQNGKRWSGNPEVSCLDHNKSLVRPKITCVSCLKIVKRWQNDK